ncbi:hypothetical protein ACIRD3_05265 [Kitasatospora sp. NPDC093550]|uniref:hypothetical protein n=1 Tax=Kitasatospora sp. NPDC093550 TaxID=3364089 RepID=UPI0038051AA1
MTESPRERPLHDMGGATGPADTAGTRSRAEGRDGPARRPAPIGKGGTPNVAGSGEQQPETAEGPVPGVQPGEEYANPPRREPTAVDPPPRGGRGGHAAPAEPTEAPPEPERGHHDPAAEPEDEGIPDLQDGSPAREWSQDPQVQSVPGDTPVAAESFGTTGAEQSEGESLDARLAQEEPEQDERTSVAEPSEQAAGRLDPPDPHSDLRADAPGDTAGLSAEEEAVRIRSDGGPSEPEGPGGDRGDQPGIETPESAEEQAPEGDAEGDRPFRP